MLFSMMILILGNKNNEIFNAFVVCYSFSCKNQQKTIKLLFCVAFASIKLLQNKFPHNNYHMKYTIIFFSCDVSFHFVC